MSGLTRVAVVEFVLQVAGVVLRLAVGPAGVGVGLVAHKHAEEDHHGHLQEQAGDRQPPAEVGVPDHPAGRAGRLAGEGSGQFGPTLAGGRGL